MRRVLVSEGDGDWAFFKQLFEVHGVSDIGVYKPEKGPRGSGAFKLMLEAAPLDRKHEDSELAIVVADCDASPEASFKNVCEQIKEAGGFAVPTRPREVASENGKRSTSILMLPWDDEPGALETICYELAAAQRPDIGSCVQSFVECVGASAWKPQQMAKLQMRSILVASCPQNPNTPLSRAWQPERRPPDLVPLLETSEKIKRILDYFRSLP